MEINNIDISLDNPNELLIYLFSCLITPLQVDGDVVIYDKQTVIQTLKILDIFISREYNFDNGEILTGSEGIADEVLLSDLRGN